MIAEPINLLLTPNLPPILNVVQRIAQVAEFKSMWMTRWNARKPIQGGCEGRDRYGNELRISFWPTQIKKHGDRTLVDVIMFFVQHENANRNFANYLPAADLERSTSWRNFAEGVGNRLRDVLDTPPSDDIEAETDPSEKGHWSDDEDIKTESIERFNREMEQDDED